MKFIAALITSIATLSAANPLPVSSTVKSSLFARADIVAVTCPALNNANEVSYSVGNIDQAFTIGSGILRMTPPDYVTGTNGQQYPRPYYNTENIALPADCQAADVIDRYEFPIRRTKTPMGEATDPGPDRVVFARVNGGTDFRYCYTVYHQDLSGGPFAQCT
jgi:hypothetical protein